MEIDTLFHHKKDKLVKALKVEMLQPYTQVLGILMFELFTNVIWWYLDVA